MSNRLDRLTEDEREVLRIKMAQDGGRHADSVLIYVERILANRLAQIPDVEIVKQVGRPATCRVTFQGVVEFDGVDRSALLESRGKNEALAKVRTWVDGEVNDYYDPVIDPEMHDALRAVVGLPPLDREGES